MGVKSRPEFADNYMRTHCVLADKTSWKSSGHRKNRRAEITDQWESNEATAGRGNGRFEEGCVGGKIVQWQQPECGGRDERQAFCGRGKFELLELQREIRFFLGGLAGGDGFAHAAGMRAIESFCHRLGKGTRLKIFREHRRPRDSLQRRPMAARRCEQRDNHQDLAEADEHVASLNLFFAAASKIRRARKSIITADGMIMGSHGIKTAPSIRSGLEPVRPGDRHFEKPVVNPALRAIHKRNQCRGHGGQGGSRLRRRDATFC